MMPATFCEKSSKTPHKRIIALVSDSRCSHGIYSPIMDAIKKSDKLDYFYIAGGMHLSDEYGRTIDIIKEEGYHVDAVMDISDKEYKECLNDKNNECKSKNISPLGIQAESIGKMIINLTEIFLKNKIDIILAQGDRGVTIASAIAGAHLNIPVAHLHGGEVSGTIDESTRHAVTKYSHIHFPATKKSAERIEKLGEHRSRIFLVGASGVEYIKNRKLVEKEALFKEYGLDINKNTAVLLQHPVSWEVEDSRKQIKETLSALEESEVEQIIIIYPNSDAGSTAIIEELKEFKSKTGKNAVIKKSIPFIEYLSLLKHSSMLIGNSSGSIIEAPSLGLPVINIGTRQTGREKAINIIDADYKKEEINKAINKTLNDASFLSAVKKCESPYDPFGDGRISERIVRVLENIKINKDLLNKVITY